MKKDKFEPYNFKQFEVLITYPSVYPERVQGPDLLYLLSQRSTLIEVRILYKLHQIVE